MILAEQRELISHKSRIHTPRHRHTHLYTDYDSAKIVALMQKPQCEGYIRKKEELNCNGIIFLLEVSSPVTSTWLAFHVWFPSYSSFSKASLFSWHMQVSYFICRMRDDLLRAQYIKINNKFQKNNLKSRTFQNKVSLTEILLFNVQSQAQEEGSTPCRWTYPRHRQCPAGRARSAGLGAQVGPIKTCGQVLPFHTVCASLGNLSLSFTFCGKHKAWHIVSAQTILTITTCESQHLSFESCHRLDVLTCEVKVKLDVHESGERARGANVKCHKVCRDVT